MKSFSEPAYLLHTLQPVCMDLTHLSRREKLELHVSHRASASRTRSGLTFHVLPRALSNNKVKTSGGGDPLRVCYTDSQAEL